MNYFAYGSNLDEAQMKRRCPNAAVVGPAMLSGYSLTFSGHSRNWGGGVATIIEAADDTVWGVLYDISKGDLEALDAFEGYPNKYTRRLLKISSCSRPGTAWVYQLVGNTDFSAPSEAYLRVILEGGARLKFPAEYATRLRTVAAAAN